MPSMGNERLTLAAIDQVGEVTLTDVHRPDDEAAMTREEAIAHHLAGSIRQANTSLDRRRKEHTDTKPREPERPAIMDGATAAFYDDGWD